MHIPLLKKLSGLVAVAAVTFLLIGCRGATGQNGLNGTNGTNGTNGNNGTSGGTGINVASYTPDTWAKLSLKGSITSVDLSKGTPIVKFSVSDGNGTPIYGLSGFTSKDPVKAVYASYPNLAFTIAKLVPGSNGSPSRWVNYIVTSTPTVAAPTSIPQKPGTDNVGTLTETFDGNYTYTFLRDITKAKSVIDSYTPNVSKNEVKTDLDDVSYQSNLTHRLAVQIGGIARGTGSAAAGDRSFNTPDASDSGKAGVNVLNPANLIYDFIPATGKAVADTDEQRNIVAVSACNTCHSKLAPHGGNRIDTAYCVTCHTDQRKYGNAEATTTATGYSGNTYKINGLAVGDFMPFIHRMHMGEGLHKDGYNYANVLFNEVTYPQDQRNCVKCHSAATTGAQGDNWFNKPSRLACGACHDQVNWATGVGHGDSNEGGPQLSDQHCATCHAPADIKTYHIPVVAPNPDNSWLGGTNANTNASFVAGYTNNLPAGAVKPSWDLKSVTVDGSRHPVFVFRLMQDGVAVPLKTFVDATTTPEFWDHFAGGPSLYLAFALPQDGISTPADWNATISAYIKDIWSGKKTVTTSATGVTPAVKVVAGTLSAPDTDGYYTATLTAYTVPSTATMLMGGIGYTYGLTSTQPLTQIDPKNGSTWGSWVGTLYEYNADGVHKQGGLSVPAPNISKLASGYKYADGVTDNAGRRSIVTTAKCNDCHATLGIFTEKVYHAGQRNDAPTCTFCHNVNRANSGWGVNIKDAVHAIHAADKRGNYFSWEASAGDQYWKVAYPAILNNCEACHVPGSYDFSASTNAAAISNLLYTTSTSGTLLKVGDPLSATDPRLVASTSVAGPGNESFDATHLAFAPWATPGTNYGKGYQTDFKNLSLLPGAVPYIDAADTTLVTSPISAACAACHDSTDAVAHMRNNGGSVNDPRSTALARDAKGNLLKVEQCMVCHGSAKIADIKAAHMNFK